MIQDQCHIVYEIRARFLDNKKTNAEHNTQSQEGSVLITFALDVTEIMSLFSASRLTECNT